MSSAAQARITTNPLSSMQAGLSTAEAEQQLSAFGLNEPVQARRRSPVVAFLLLFLNPLAAILLISAVFSAFLGQKVDASLMALIVVLGISVNFYQTYRSERAIESLRARVRSTVWVKRDGEWREMPRHDVVPGDIIRLYAGDVVPADSQLLESKDLFIQQGSLTGESLPVEKDANPNATPSDDPEDSHMVFLGTSVVSGTGIALVSATGPRTVFGGIAARLAAKPPETEFERGLRKFSLLIMRVVLFLLLVLMVSGAVLHHNALETLLFAVALAVGLTPEFLPMITSVTLARGAQEMARRSVIVKRLPAIQNLGSIDILCSDKTGTLTGGVMKLQQSVDAFGSASEKTLLLGYLNSKFETGVRNPLNAAVLEAPCPNSVEEYSKCDEIPFDFERRRISIVAQRQGKTILISKGAPEALLAGCTRAETAGSIKPLTDEDRARSQAKFAEFSAAGFRVLAVAFREIEKRERYSIDDEADLTMAGYLTFADPPRPDTEATVAALRSDGVALKIITGDNELVTRHVCGQVKLEAGEILLGSEIERMTDSALEHVVEQTTVFARVSPAQKNRIISALRRRGHVVGYMGDGINDAPSLHAADVGISVDGAADVARDAADIILLQPGLNVLHAGILEGRRASGNVLKYLLMGTSSNFGNMLSMAGASFFLPFLPMLPTQILLNNFMYDVSQITIPSDRVDPDYLRRPQRWNISLIERFMVLIGPISSVYDFLTFYVLLRVFQAGEREFHTGWFVESLATQTLVLFVIRTFGNPLKMRASRALTATVLAVVAIALILPFTVLGRLMGFTALPGLFYLFLVLATLTYLAMVEFAKQKLFQKYVPR